MIIRELKQDPDEVLKTFDWFNDYKDTRKWAVYYYPEIVCRLDGEYNKWCSTTKFKEAVVDTWRLAGDEIAQLVVSYPSYGAVDTDKAVAGAEAMLSTLCKSGFTSLMGQSILQKLVDALMMTPVRIIPTSASGDQGVWVWFTCILGRLSKDPIITSAKAVDLVGLRLSGPLLALAQAKAGQHPKQQEKQKPIPSTHAAMILTEEQREEFNQAAKPLLKWLNDNCNPHVTVVVTPISAELSEGVHSLSTMEFVRD